MLVSLEYSYIFFRKVLITFSSDYLLHSLYAHLTLWRAAEKVLSEHFIWLCKQNAFQISHETEISLFHPSHINTRYVALVQNDDEDEDDLGRKRIYQVMKYFVKILHDIVHLYTPLFTI